MLVDFFNAIMERQSWPESLSSAWVALLAKVPQPLQPKDGRPITVLPTLYRLWSKIMASKTFRAMIPFLPEDLYGSVPGKSTLDTAWELQSTLEESMEDQDSIAGVTLDLSKAYNTLPRPFLYQLAAKSGWPAGLINTYDSFLGSLTRFFRIHEGLHRGTKSKVGVPEGCPLAVPMMILLTMGVTNLVLVRSQQGRLISYVDNRTMTTSTVDSLQSLLHTVKWATDGLCLLLNPGKTAAFATTPQARSDMRRMSFAGFPLSVFHTTHDLGVTFTSTRRATSMSISDRLTAINRTSWIVCRCCHGNLTGNAKHLKESLRLPFCMVPPWRPLLHHFWPQCEESSRLRFGGEEATVIISWLHCCRRLMPMNLFTGFFVIDCRPFIVQPANNLRQRSGDGTSSLNQPGLQGLFVILLSSSASLDGQQNRNIRFRL